MVGDAAPFVKDLSNSCVGSSQKALITIAEHRCVSAQSSSDAGVVHAAAELLAGAAGGVSESFHYPPHRRIFAVQFNPASLHIYSYRKPIVRKTPSAFDGQGLYNQQTENATTLLTVRLIFDAFTGEQPSPAAWSVGIHMPQELGRQRLTVRHQINGLVYAAMNPALKQITFAWSNFSFTGTADKVQAEYTMFSASGEPIRGQIDLCILQDNSRDDAKQIAKAFDTAFGTADRPAFVVNRFK